MEKSNFEEAKKAAWDAGENDTITEDKLIEGAQLFLDEFITATDEQRDELIEAYRQGFMGKKLSPDFFNCLRLSRDDFEIKGFDASALTDEEMESIANHIGEGAMESFWYSLEWHAEDRKLPVIDIED